MGGGGTDLLGEQSSMLILHCPVLSKHIVKLLDDFSDREARGESMRPGARSQGET